MTTLTLHLDSDLAERARLVAEQRQTTLDELVQAFLERLALEGETPRRQAAERLVKTLHALSRPLGGKPWRNRDELYER